MNVLPDHRRQPTIAMWGTPGSGKTTFLAALDIALSRRDTEWKLVGRDQASTDALSRMTLGLASKQRFPEATLGTELYRWSLVGNLPTRRRRWRRRVPEARLIRIELNVVDRSGEVFASGQAGHLHREDVVDSLVNSKGLVYMFDPLREHEYGDAFDHLHGVLVQLGQRMFASGDLEGGRLPHYVAVCVAKFDEIRVLQTAEKLQLVTVDPDDPLQLPRVEDEDAADLFRALCQVSASGNGELVTNALAQWFHPDRIKYFVTSAIGFHIDPGLGAYDPDDYQNLMPDPAERGSWRIRGQVHPINVSEPLLWLGQQLAVEEDE
ncbi:hypothetical protein [Actinomadura nitritigenes]|uniref:hypothetical protein n=1 Tax=Actinomadura nitritigenes TaxID=134602 RepID=UPI003D91FB66